VPVPGVPGFPVARAARTLASVDPPATAIHLEVRLDGALPIGRAYDDRGSSREFAGWMALVATIDDFLTTATATATATATGTDTGSPDDRVES
jgi:hypothetical protein